METTTITSKNEVTPVIPLLPGNNNDQKNTTSLILPSQNYVKLSEISLASEVTTLKERERATQNELFTIREELKSLKVGSKEHREAVDKIARDNNFQTLQLRKDIENLESKLVGEFFSQIEDQWATLDAESRENDANKWWVRALTKIGISEDAILDDLSKIRFDQYHELSDKNMALRLEKEYEEFIEEKRLETALLWSPPDDNNTALPVATSTTAKEDDGGDNKTTTTIIDSNVVEAFYKSKIEPVVDSTKALEAELEKLLLRISEEEQSPTPTTVSQQTATVVEPMITANDDDITTPTNEVEQQQAVVATPMIAEKEDDKELFLLLSESQKENENNLYELQQSLASTLEAQQSENTLQLSKLSNQMETLHQNLKETEKDLKIDRKNNKKTLRRMGLRLSSLDARNVFLLVTISSIFSNIQEGIGKMAEGVWSLGGLTDEQIEDRKTLIDIKDSVARAKVTGVTSEEELQKLEEREKFIREVSKAQNLGGQLDSFNIEQDFVGDLSLNIPPNNLIANNGSTKTIDPPSLGTTVETKGERKLSE